MYNDFAAVLFNTSVQRFSAANALLIRCETFIAFLGDIFMNDRSLHAKQSYKLSAAAAWCTSAAQPRGCKPIYSLRPLGARLLVNETFHFVFANGVITAD